MLFSEFLTGLKPFCSSNQNNREFIIEVIKNWVKDEYLSSFQLLSKQEATLGKIFSGHIPLAKKHAQFLYANRDIDKFVSWLHNEFDNADSFEAVQHWLNENDIDSNGINVEFEVAITLENILESYIQPKKAVDKNSRNANQDKKILDDVKEKISRLSSPNPVSVPKIPTNEEKYIYELLECYADDSQLDALTLEELNKYPFYKDDFDDRRIEYYFADTIRRGCLESNDETQFDILKDDIHQNVKDTARKRYPSGYERMLSVMENAASLTVTPNYYLGFSPNWISPSIKKGVCHHLVNDNKLKWVLKR